ncbi:MAG: hypothetical protein BMS9Abin13_150 [Patescibacteria group bacterium]|nr:MAG: hypothetical protein BMS9Abin13_150 [Patescibacteria group bacterium]
METQFGERNEFTTPEEEIHFLRAQMEDKERALEVRGERMPRAEIAAEKVREYVEKPPEEVLSSGHQMKVDEIEEKVLHFSTEHEKAVDELVDVVEEKGIKNALEVAEKLGPHIRDDFHRLLVQYLVELGTVPGLKEGTVLFKSLRMKLFEVALPKVNPEKQVRKFSELVAGMEQFYAGMLSVAQSNGDKEMVQHFTIEITRSNYEEEIVFYCAVPRVRERLFEKQLLAVFPDARIDEHKEDFNPFNANGATLASYALASDNPILPIKTYDMFEHDPLNILLNAFSKINREGEGAAIQLVFSPAGDTYNKRYKSALDKVRKGETLKRATEGDGVRIAKEFGGAFKDAFFGASKSSKKEDKTLKEGEETIEGIVNKIASPILDTNIRLVASAGNEESAEMILSELEAAFNQFDKADGNGISFSRLTGKKLSAFLREFIYRMYNKDRSFPLNIKELTTMFHFPVTAVATAELREEEAKRAPAVSGVSEEGILLGVNRYRNKDTQVRFKREDRVRHFYVIGQTGTGKTTLLKNMIIQDIENGDGVCMIDPHGSDLQDILANIPKERIDDVIYFDPAYTARPMGLNMLEYDRRYPEQKTFVVDELFGIFQKLYAGSPESMGPMFEQYFRNSAMLVVEDPETGNTLLDVSRVMIDEKFRELKLSRSKNPVINQFWRSVATKAGGEAALANIVPYITSKFDVFLANEIMRPIIAQEKSAFNFRQIMDERKILLVNLSKGRLGDINSNLIGLIVVGKILMAALSRVDAPAETRHDFYLYIDEFQNVTTNSISTILSEARKYRLGLNIAHQFIAQLDDGIRDSVFGNVGSIATYRVGSEDAEFLEKQFAPVFDAKDIMNIENFNAYLKLLVNGSPVAPFNITAMPAPKGDPDVAEKIKKLSYLKYGRDRAEVEEEIMKKYRG